MKVQFTATDGWDEAVDNDASGILINSKLMIDVGYYGVKSLKRLGIKPQEIEHILFTHMHHDHYMALPHIIFHWLQVGKPLSELNLYGPKADLSRVVRLAMEFLQAGNGKPFYSGCESPTVHELSPGDLFEAVGLSVRVGEANHAVDCLSARITENTSGRVLGVTGDTFYSEKLVENLRGCDLLVHETALAASPVDFDNPPSNGHSGIASSLRTAKECGTKRLAVIHFARTKAPEVLKIAEKSGLEVFCPELYKEYEI